MSWAESVLSVWQWGKEGLGDQYNIHLRPVCPDCPAQSSFPPVSASTQTSSSPFLDMAPTSGLVRIAGLSGALAIGLGAYGAHSLAAQEVSQDRHKAFEVANRYHLIHSAALLALPLASKPRLSGSLMLGGMALFCGTCYYHALTGEKSFRQFTPYGGVLLILAWVSLIL
jgi:uncharacterized membrane protein YgdD (TMEM256/DUF423 family)